MTHPAGLAEAAEDPRFLPRTYFACVGALVAIALLLLRVHVLSLVIPGIGMICVFLLAHRRGAYAVDERAKNAIALHSPLPGTMGPVIAAVTLSLTAASVIVGSLVPTRLVAHWAVVLTAFAVGTAVALLLRRAELLRVAGTRRLETRDD